MIGDRVEEINEIEVVAIVHDNQDQSLACFQCEMCSFNVDSENDMKLHMDVKHGQHGCKGCDNTFWDIDDFKEHKKKCHMKLSIKCKDCEFTAENVSLLMKHKGEAHTHEAEIMEIN